MGEQSQRPHQLLETPRTLPARTGGELQVLAVGWGWGLRVPGWETSKKAFLRVTWRFIGGIQGAGMVQDLMRGCGSPWTGLGSERIWKGLQEDLVTYRKSWVSMGLTGGWRIWGIYCRVL